MKTTLLTRTFQVEAAQAGTSSWEQKCPALPDRDNAFAVLVAQRIVAEHKKEPVSFRVVQTDRILLDA